MGRRKGLLLLLLAEQGQHTRCHRRARPAPPMASMGKVPPPPMGGGRRRGPRGQIGSHKVTWRKWIDRSNAADRNVAPIRIGYSGACAVADQDPIARLQLGSPGNRRETRAPVYQRRPLVTNHREREAPVIYGRGILIPGHGLVCGWWTPDCRSRARLGQHSRPDLAPLPLSKHVATFWFSYSLPHISTAFF